MSLEQLFLLSLYGGVAFDIMIFISKGEMFQQPLFLFYVYSRKVCLKQPYARTMQTDERMDGRTDTQTNRQRDLGKTQKNLLFMAGPLRPNPLPPRA